MDPPDFVGKAADQVLFVRDHEGGGAGAADAVERDGSALAHQQVLFAEGAIDEEDGRRREIQRIVGPEVFDIARGLDGA